MKEVEEGSRSKTHASLGKKVILPKDSSGIHNVAGLIKLYLRELPEPLLTFELSPCFRAASNISDTKSRLHCIRNAIQMLPPGCRELFRRLCKLLSMVSKRADKNKMSSSNLAIVFSPTLLQSPLELQRDMFTLMKDTEKGKQVLKDVIENYSLIFKRRSSFDRLLTSITKDFYEELTEGTRRLTFKLIQEKLHRDSINVSEDEVDDSFSNDHEQWQSEMELGLERERSFLEASFDEDCQRRPRRSLSSPSCLQLQSSEASSWEKQYTETEASQEPGPSKAYDERDGFNAESEDEEISYSKSPSGYIIKTARSPTLILETSVERYEEDVGSKHRIVTTTTTKKLDKTRFQVIEEEEEEEEDCIHSTSSNNLSAVPKPAKDNSNSEDFLSIQISPFASPNQSRRDSFCSFDQDEMAECQDCEPAASFENWFKAPSFLASSVDASVDDLAEALLAGHYHEVKRYVEVSKNHLQMLLWWLFLCQYYLPSLPHSFQSLDTSQLREKMKELGL